MCIAIICSINHCNYETIKLSGFFNIDFFSVLQFASIMHVLHLYFNINENFQLWPVLNSVCPIKFIEFI